MEANQIYLAIIGCALVTVLCRWLPIVLFSKREFSPKVKSFLHFCPIAILCAMIAPDVFIFNSRFDLSFANKFFWVFIPCLVIATKTKNIGITVVCSAGILAFWRYLEGMA